MEKKSFIVHEQWVAMFADAPDADVGAIFKAMMKYTMTGEIAEVSPMQKIILKMMIDTYEADKAKYEETCRKRKEAVEKRWNKPIQADTNEYKSIQMYDDVSKSDTNVYNPIQTDTDKDKELDKDKDKDKELDNNIPFPSGKGFKKKDDKSSQKENRIPQDTLNEIIARWNTLPDPVPRLTTLKAGTKRYESLSARLSEYGTDDVMIAIEKVRKSSFLCGRSSTWHISFDWFVLPNNFPKVLDGNYTDSEQEQKPKSKGSMIDEWIEKGLLQ